GTAPGRRSLRKRTFPVPLAQCYLSCTCRRDCIGKCMVWCPWPVAGRSHAGQFGESEFAGGPAVLDPPAEQRYRDDVGGQAAQGYPVGGGHGGGAAALPPFLYGYGGVSAALALHDDSLAPLQPDHVDLALGPARLDDQYVAVVFEVVLDGAFQLGAVAVAARHR